MSPQKQALQTHIAGRATGPRTEEAKAISSQNRLTHGLCAKKHAIHPSHRPEFERHYNEMLAALAPIRAEESQLAEAIILDQYRMARARQLENEIFIKGIADAEDRVCPPAETWAKNAKDLALLTLYSQRIPRVLVRNQADFAARQAARKAAERAQSPAIHVAALVKPSAAEFVHSTVAPADPTPAGRLSVNSPVAGPATPIPVTEAQIAA